jgi:hypothetical protein
MSLLKLYTYDEDDLLYLFYFLLPHTLTFTLSSLFSFSLFFFFGFLLLFLAIHLLKEYNIEGLLQRYNEHNFIIKALLSK